MVDRCSLSHFFFLRFRGRSDPFAVVLASERGGAFRELGRTETIWDNLSPSWTKQFKATYHFEMIQKFKIQVYDRDATSTRGGQRTKLSQHDFIGEAAFTLGQLMGARGQSIHLELTQPGKARKRTGYYGYLIVKAEEIHACNDIMVFQNNHNGKRLTSPGYFGTDLAGACAGKSTAIFRASVTV